MNSFSIISTKRPRGFEVRSSDGRLLAQIRQPGLFSQNMEGNVEGGVVRISSEGFWRTRYAVELEGTRRGTIATGTWGELKLSLNFTSLPPVELEFAHAGRWWKYYHLRIDKSLPLLEVRPVFRWSSFSTDYEVEVKAPGIAQEQMPLMLALCGFCARLMQARAHAGVAAGT